MTSINSSKDRFRSASLIIELALLGAFFWFDYTDRISLPVSNPPYLFLIGWLSLRLRGLRWRDVGWSRPSDIRQTAIVALISAVIFQLFSLLVMIPIATRLTGETIDLSLLEQIEGNPVMLLVGLITVWILAAFGEEFVYRGYLLNRISDVTGQNMLGWGLALLISSFIFGIIHFYQGIVGVIDTGVSGLVFGGLYLMWRRNLWMPILTHGFSNSIALVLAFLGVL